MKLSQWAQIEHNSIESNNVTPTASNIQLFEVVEEETQQIKAVAENYKHACCTYFTFLRFEFWSNALPDWQLIAWDYIVKLE